MMHAAAQPVYLKDYQVPPFLIDTVDLTFVLGEDATLVTSRLTVRRNQLSPSPAQALTLDGVCLELVALTLDGVDVTKEGYQVDEASLTIANVPEQFELVIVTRIKPHLNTSLSGLYQSSGNLCTQCEAEGFRRITYFLDRPDVMSCYTTTIIADAGRYPVLLSNGNLVAKHQRADGTQVATWKDPYKKPCYLFALVAGKLEVVEDVFVTQSGRTITLQLFVEKENVDKTAHALLAQKKSMRWDELHYGREYDLDCYMIVAVNDFNMGAMENKGLNLFNTHYVLAKPETATDMDYVNIESVIGHEYFHNWTGNRITCRDWFQLSLKEGLTVFREQCFTGDMTSTTVSRIRDVNHLRQTQFVEDAGPLAHPVRPESYVEINNFYTTTIYEKGAEVIRMQRVILGDDLFRKGMDLYFSRHDGCAVTIEDFVTSMEDASGIDLTQFRHWYTQAGTPWVTVSDSYDEKNKTYALYFKQSCAKTPDQPTKQPWHIPVKIGLINETGQELQSSLVQLKQAEEVVYFSNIAQKPIPSLLREFSAPIKLVYPYTDQALSLLFQHDSDAFNRWEAGQKMALNLMLRLLAQRQQGKPLTLSDDYISALAYQLRSSQYDKLFLVELLSLPTEKYLSEQLSVIDVDAVHHVREFLLSSIAHHLKDDLLACYMQHADLNNPYVFTMEAMGKRQLANHCLFYLAALEEKAIFENIIIPQFTNAMKHNMTDTMAALKCIVNAKLPYRDQALQAFYEQWQHDPLVMDKWLTLQATSKLPDTLSHVKKLVSHPSFDVKNPNKVYALIGSFAYQNTVRFHAEDGAGYQFLRSFVEELDALNPQVAARIVKPLSDWRRFDHNRQQLMRHQLEKIVHKKNISRDVGELVNKSLEGEGRLS